MSSVLPAINCTDEKCVRARFLILNKLNAPWIHVDVSDGTFTSARTWSARTPKDFFTILSEENASRSIEAHLMVRDGVDLAKKWLDAGAKRVIVHAEVNPDISALKQMCNQFNASLMVSFLVTTPLESVRSYIDTVDAIQILAVPPGFSGGVFNKKAISLVKELRALYPSATIEVDGGIVPETAREVFQAGGSSVVSGSYIFGNSDSEQAFQSLCAAENIQN